MVASKAQLSQRCCLTQLVPKPSTYKKAAGICRYLRYHCLPTMMESNLQHALVHKNPTALRVGHKQLLHRISSSHDAILEFDPATGTLKVWAWYVRLRYIVVGVV
jgi:hypothetical protein